MAEDDQAIRDRMTSGFVRHVPHNHALGIEVLGVGDRAARFRLPWAEHLVGNPEAGVLHGGPITALLDACCGAAVFAALTELKPIATLDLRIDYLKPAEPRRDVIARAECYRVTRNVAFVRAMAFHDEADPIAAAAGTFMLGTRPGGCAMSLVERFAAAREAGTLGALINEVPYARWLGLCAAEVGPELIVTMKYAPELIGNASLPALHGGTLGALLESAAIFELLWRSETLVLPKTITLTIDYLRPAGPRDTHARGVVTRHGKRVANVRCEAWQDDRNTPVASAHAIFLVMPPGT